MNKEELINLLKDYKENKAKLTISLKELKNARFLLKDENRYETNLTSSFGINQDIHSKNQVSDKVSKKVEQNDNKRIEIEKRIEDLEERVKELREKVDEVDDRLQALKYRERELLYAYYIEGRTYTDIGNNLYFKLFAQTRDKDSIKRIVEKAVNKMLIL